MANPFDPDNLPGVGDFGDQYWLLQDLMRQPLQVHVNPVLKQLVCSKNTTLLERFKEDLARKKYTQNPSAVGRFSIIAGIYGPGGTGKSTLANLMIDYVKLCGVPATNWVIHERWRDTPEADPAAQKKEIEDLAAHLVGEPNGGLHCIVLDNIAPSAIQAALTVWQDLRKRLRIILLMISSDVSVIDNKFRDSAFQINAYPTTALTPEEALDFVKCRFDTFRPTPPDNIRDYPLFPFSREDILESVNTKDTLAGVSDRKLIVLRQWSTTLHSRLNDYTARLSDDFDLAKLSPTEVRAGLIRLTDSEKAA